MQPQLLAGIDLGSSSFCVTVAERAGDGGLRYIGHGSTPADGIGAGVIYDAAALTEALRGALDEIARLAGYRVADVILSVCGARLRAVDRHGGCRLELATPVTADDVMRALPPLDAAALGDGHAVHRVVGQITLDGQPLADPTGRIGKRLEVGTRDYVAPATWLTELQGALERAGGRLHACVPEGVAAGAATLSDAERAEGVVLADVGALTTDVAVYVSGALRELLCVPFGGQHVTLDLAQVFDIDAADAEELKLRHGAADPFNAATPGIEWGPRGIATLQRLAAQGNVPREAAQAIAGARARMLCEALDEALTACGVSVRLDAPAGIVCTGGGAKLAGLDAIAEDVFGVPARCAGVRAAAGFPEIPDPAVSASIGLVRYCAGRLQDAPRPPLAASGRGRAARAERSDRQYAAASAQIGHNAFSGVAHFARVPPTREWGRWMAHWMRGFIPARAAD
jgi:cell division protein FtsA